MSMSKTLMGLPTACLTGTHAWRQGDLTSEDILHEALSSAGYLTEETQGVPSDDQESSQQTFSPNEDAIAQCDVMLVSLAGLRWDDCQLAWELGFAFGKGKMIIGFRPAAQDNTKWEETHGMFFDHIVSSAQELDYVLRLARLSIGQGSTTASSCREQSECDDLLEMQGRAVEDLSSPTAIAI